MNKPLKHPRVYIAEFKIGERLFSQQLGIAWTRNTAQYLRLKGNYRYYMLRQGLHHFRIYSEALK